MQHAIVEHLVDSCACRQSAHYPGVALHVDRNISAVAPCPLGNDGDATSRGDAQGNTFVIRSGKIGRAQRHCTARLDCAIQMDTLTGLDEHHGPRLIADFSARGKVGTGHDTPINNHILTTDQADLAVCGQGVQC